MTWSIIASAKSPQNTDVRRAFAKSAFTDTYGRVTRLDLCARLVACTRVMQASDPTDLRLMQRIAARDTAALAELYDRHSRLLFSLILRIVRDRGEAEEILQEAFVRVWTRAEIYDARIGGPLPWIVRVARNCAIDRLRALRIRAAVDAPAIDLAAVEALRHGHPDPGGSRIEC